MDRGSLDIVLKEGRSGAKYEPPALVELGTLHELTLGCNKDWGGSDGFTFQQTPIVCTSP